MSTRTPRLTSEDTAHDRQSNTMPSCDECNSVITCLKNTIGHTEWVCGNCGLVLEEDKLLRAPDWRAYTSEERRHRRRVGMGADDSYQNKGLGVGFPNISARSDFSPSPIPIEAEAKDGNRNITAIESKKSRMERLAKTAKREEYRGRDQSIKKGLKEVRRLVSALNLSRVARETAGRLFQRAAAEDVLTGRNVDEVTAGVVFVAAYQVGEPRLFSRVAAETDVDKRTVRDEYRNLMRQLALSPFEPDPVDVVPRVITRLTTTCEVTFENRSAAASPALLLMARAEELLDCVAERGTLVNTSWRTLVASALYAATLIEEISVTQKEVAAAANASADAIRGCYRQVVAASDYNLD